MSSLIFDIPHDDPISPQREMELPIKRRLREIADSMREGERLAEEEEARRATLPKERLITLMMPTEMIERLDLIAKDADVSRSQLIRQIAADFMNYVWVNGVRFRGSLLGFKQRPLEDRDEN